MRDCLESFLFQAVDAGSLAYFRIVFGGLMFLGLLHKLPSGTITRDYVAPPFHFSYPGFAWVHPLPEFEMHLLFGLLAISALCVAIGLGTRAAAGFLTVGLTYVFLLDATYYLNHEYLICLLSGLLVILPANRLWSLDAKLFPRLRSERVPAWTLRLLQFQLALPYFFGGVAKLNSDWLRGQPLMAWIPESSLSYLLGDVALSPTFAIAMSWGGMLFDLAIVPLLFWRRTRVAAVVVTAIFHLTNAVTFDIGIFPWLMLFSVFVFFPSDWLRTLLKIPYREKLPAVLPPHSRAIKMALISLLGIYVTLHCVLPFRHLLIPGDANWTEEGHNFAWRMMLRDKNTALQFVVKNKTTGEKQPIDPTQFLTPFQIEAMGYDAEMMRQFARFLSRKMQASGLKDMSVHVIAITSLNGRKPQFLFDPSLDLAAVPPVDNPGFEHKAWLFPLEEPFRAHPWEKPAIEWLEHVDRKELIEGI